MYRGGRDNDLPSGQARAGFNLYIHENSSKKWDFWTGGGSTWPTITSSSARETYKWTHLVMRYNHLTQTLDAWVNGVSQGSTTSTYYPTGGDHNGSPSRQVYYIGQAHDGTVPFYGYIYDHRHYDYAISDDDIQALYNRRLSPGQEVLHVPLSNPHQIDRVITKAEAIYNNSLNTQNVARFRGQQFLWIHHIKASTLSTPAVTKTYWLYFPDQDHYYFHRRNGVQECIITTRITQVSMEM